jgi:hypothetical protein
MILGAIFVCIAAYGYGHHAGFAQRDQEMQAEIAAKNEQSRLKEQELSNQLNQSEVKLQEANHAIDQKQSSLDRAIRSGKLRLPTTGCVQASASPAPASGNSDQAGSESDREVLAAIAAIIAQGDRNTEQLNACIDAYNAVRSQVNDQR